MDELRRHDDRKERKPIALVAGVSLLLFGMFATLSWYGLSSRYPEFGLTILLPTVIVAFAAFCVWLAVRIVNRRERWAKWTAVGALTVMLGYPLSIGPACWIACRNGEYIPSLSLIYWPLGQIAERADFVYVPLSIYARFWTRPGSMVAIPTGPLARSTRIFLVADTPSE